jgi:selenide,water dikinase
MPETFLDLMSLTPGAGCGCKLPLSEMNELLEIVSRIKSLMPASENVRLDETGRDDAALYEISPGFLLAASVDFGTPVSSDPSTWARIATQNALSDIYSMGAEPALAMAILALPSRVGRRTVHDLMESAVATLTESSTPLVGGHTIVSKVPLFGLAVIGTVYAKSVMLTRNAKPDDLLVVTKPLGTGVILATQKAGLAPPEAVTAATIVMERSNRVASRLAVASGVKACTDVTGYGFIGHLHNMLNSSGCGGMVAASDVPVLSQAVSLLTEHAVVPNSAENNYFATEDAVDWGTTPFELRIIMSDPQTSGGLLLAISEANIDQFLSYCRSEDQSAVVVGSVVLGEPGHIEIT